MPKYNGHKNRNHWNVSLWLNNDEGLYRAMLEAIRATPTRRDAAIALKYMIGRTHTPDGVPYSISAIRAAMVGLEVRP